MYNFSRLKIYFQNQFFVQQASFYFFQDTFNFRNITDLLLIASFVSLLLHNVSISFSGELLYYIYRMYAE